MLTGCNSSPRSCIVCAFAGYSHSCCTHWKYLSPHVVLRCDAQCSNLPFKMIVNLPAKTQSERINPSHSNCVWLLYESTRSAIYHFLWLNKFIIILSQLSRWICEHHAGSQRRISISFFYSLGEHTVHVDVRENNIENWVKQSKCIRNAWQSQRSISFCRQKDRMIGEGSNTRVSILHNSTFHRYSLTKIFARCKRTVHELDVSLMPA